MANEEGPDVGKLPHEKVRDKLVRTKEQWARDGRLLTGSPDLTGERRLPPGQRLVRDWPVLDLGVQPDLALDDWSLRIDGLVERPKRWDFAAFCNLPQVDCISDIHCVTAWSRYDNRWTGVSSRHLIATVRPKDEARHVIFHAYDGYTTNVRLDVLREEDVLLAHSWEGKPLTRQHGGPVRVVIPKWYFWKSAKWIKRIEFSAVDKPGFWEVRGYHNDGDPWREERYNNS